jgi:hypothetical protein
MKEVLMITGLLTHNSVVPEKRLLAAVIAKSITDCCERPTGSKKDPKLSEEARGAMRFLFSNNFICQLYFELLDIDLPSFRTHLVATMHIEKETPHISSGQKRAFRSNYARFAPASGET